MGIPWLNLDTGDLDKRPEQVLESQRFTPPVREAVILSLLYFQSVNSLRQMPCLSYAFEVLHVLNPAHAQQVIDIIWRI